MLKFAIERKQIHKFSLYLKMIFLPNIQCTAERESNLIKRKQLDFKSTKNETFNNMLRFNSPILNAFTFKTAIFCHETSYHFRSSELFLWYLCTCSKNDVISLVRKIIVV